MKEFDSWSDLQSQSQRMRMTPRASAWNRIRDRLDHRRRRQLPVLRIMNWAAIGLLLIGTIAVLRWWSQQPSVKVEGEVLVNQAPVPIADYPNMQRYQKSAPDYADHVQLTAAANIQRHLQFANAMDHLPSGDPSWVPPLHGNWTLEHAEDAGKLPWTSITFDTTGVFQWKGTDGRHSWQFLKLPQQSTYYVLQNSSDSLILIRYTGGNTLTVMHYNENSGHFDQVEMRKSKEG